jgi:hypothetical protein
MPARRKMLLAAVNNLFSRRLVHREPTQRKSRGTARAAASVPRRTLLHILHS